VEMGGTLRDIVDQWGHACTRRTPPRRHDEGMGAWRRRGGRAGVSHAPTQVTQNACSSYRRHGARRPRSSMWSLGPHRYSGRASPLCISRGCPRTDFANPCFPFAGIVSPYAIVSFVPVGLAFYFLQVVYGATSRELKRMDAISRSPVYAHFSETLSG
jgi:hypothetical protein